MKNKANLCSNLNFKMYSFIKLLYANSKCFLYWEGEIIFWFLHTHFKKYQLALKKYLYYHVISKVLYRYQLLLFINMHWALRSVCRWANRGTSMLNNLPKITQLIYEGAGNEVQVITCISEFKFLPPALLPSRINGKIHTSF